MSKKDRLVVVGGSAAGPSAAAKAGRVNPDLEVSIYEQGPFVSYGA
jgi:flavin-dependent dehydrogenase